MKYSSGVCDLHEAFLKKECVVLYLGMGVQDAQLSGDITDKMWSGVITSQRDSKLDECFRNSYRIPRRFTSFKDISGEFSKDGFRSKSIPLVFLRGIEQAEEEPDDDEVLLSLKELSERMGISSRLVVYGYDPEKEGEISEKRMLKFLDLCAKRGVKINVFSREEVCFSSFTEYDCFAQDLEEFFFVADSDLDGDTDYSESEEELFYCNHKPYKIPRDILYSLDDNIELLTIQKVHGNRISGSEMHRKKFFDFLDKSGDEPQWYGYDNGSKYYVKRDYEDNLFELVNKKLDDNKTAKPIMLCGRPCSSKSIEMAAVAVRVFDEKNYPVIYIRDRDEWRSFATDNGLRIQLSEFMKKVEDSITGEQRMIFLVWDSARFDTAIGDALELKKYLDDQGRRRFIFLFSSQFTDKDDRVIRVNASPEMSENEKKEFEEKIKEYSEIDAREQKLIFQSAEKDGRPDNLFELFYNLVRRLRPKLQEGLRKEEKLVFQYLKKQVRTNDFNERIKYNPFYLALGGDESIESLRLSEDKLDDEEYDFDGFGKCVAVLGKYKMDTPADLAMHVLCRGEAKNRVLFDTLVDQKAFIRYKTDVDGKGRFGFWNPLEAKLFLKNNETKPEEYRAIACSMLDYYYLCCKNHEDSDELRYSVQYFWRLIGPNSKYYQFADQEEKKEQTELCSGLNELIEHLENVFNRKDWQMKDENYGFTIILITFTREYYGRNYPSFVKEKDDEETYRLRLTKLMNAMRKARQCIDELDKNEGRIKSEQTSLVSELCNLDAVIAEISDKYREKFHKEPRTTDDKDITRYGYENLYNRLNKTIYSDPRNEYLYAALFDCFTAEYKAFFAEKETVIDEVKEEKAIRDLSNVMLHVDNAINYLAKDGSSNWIKINGKMLDIIEYSEHYAVSIDDLEKELCPDIIKKAYEKNPVAIMYFACRKALKTAKLIDDVERDQKTSGELNGEQLEICEKVIGFLKNDVIGRNNTVLMLKLRVTWMYYNKLPIDELKEHQKTRIEKKGWESMEEICRLIIDNGSSLAQGISQYIQPIVICIRAMAMICFEECSGQAFRDANELLTKMDDKNLGRTRRNFIPYIVCDHDGQPVEFEGIVDKLIETKPGQGKILVDNKEGLQVFCNFKRFYGKSFPPRTSLKGSDKFCIGVGYNGLAAYPVNFIKREWKEGR